MIAVLIAALIGFGFLGGMVFAFLCIHADMIRKVDRMDREAEEFAKVMRELRL